ncbi:MAG: hypothetical protein AMJ94_15565 [Deltaproteobacteria bacterium SM23_61]|nr:MAG: hypothetical protein AMJ94_15565 [Deltaproteobacteria bacterium SM23_61]
MGFSCKAEGISKSHSGRNSLTRRGRMILLVLAGGFLWQMAFSPHLSAFTIIEKKVFKEGPYLFKLEVQVYGTGSSKKIPLRVNSVKVKIKNERASSQTLEVKTVRAYLEPQVFQDLETKGYRVSPGQWVTKYYRLRKGKRPLLGEQGFIHIAFNGFAITFSPKERKFQGPFK